MKKILYLVVVIVAIIVAYSILGGSSEEEYLIQAESKRNEKLDFLESSDQSPFRQFDVEYFKPTYYPISRNYSVRAKLQRITSTQRVVIENSDGTSDIYVKFAFANFKLKDQPLQLLILKPTGFGNLKNYFTAFADDTSGKTTYGGGRYLDLDIGNSDNIIIDFNQTYNPYCAYAAGYSCPLPPAENILNVSIEAGEKDYIH
ncbi:MAG: hypothetical protein ACJA08_000866 [Cyclobacteriaceae bacterium]